MSSSLLLGLFFWCYGLLTLSLRFLRPDSTLFSKLAVMREVWGYRAGTVLHWVSYTVLPIVIGSMLVASAFQTIAIR